MVPAELIEIDGSNYEGGGGILRTACALSAVTQKPCRVFNIRQRRPRPGLAHQHLLGIRALAELCHGRLEGAELGSKEIKFFPGQTYRDQVSIDIPTAGSITLILQTLIPTAWQAPSPIRIKFKGGATDTFFSPTLDFFRYLFLKILEQMGIKAEIAIQKRGYYPEGGAQLKASFSSCGGKIKTLTKTKRGELIKILAFSGASESLKKKKVAERQLQGAREILGKLKLPLEERIEYYPTQSPGSQICLVAEFENTLLGTDNLGRLGKRAEEVGREAALELLREQKSQACLDKHLADQILPYLALARGKSQIRVSEITEHCRTNIWVIEKFFDGNFEIKNSLITWLPTT